MHVVLTDFGLARLISQTACVGTKTMLAGSPGYQSPEQLRAENSGPPSDVYAFGAVMVVSLQKSPLWPGLNCFQIMQKVTTNVKPDTQGIASDLKQLCDQCFDPVGSRPGIQTVLKKLHAILFC